MDSQLFDTKTDPLTGRARFSVPHNQTRTSKAAAAHVEKTEANNTGERLVLKMLAAPMWVNGATREQIEDTLGMKTQTVCPRVNKLVEKGHARVVGEKTLRTGRKGNVYQITDAGRERVGGGAA